MRPPSVDALARLLAGHHGLAGLPPPLLVDAARIGIAAAVAAGDPGSAEERALEAARVAARRLLQTVVNATGTLLHTNLGRAPLAPAAVDGDEQRVVRYSTLEFDLVTGQRGSRRAHASTLLARLTGAESGLVVNNCAAAVMLVLAALAQGRGVAVSRGELVEIGGGFRIPDVMEQSGARLVEVGTTNRTRLADFTGAAERHPDLALALKVHRSNYRISGFVEEASVEELATLSVPVVADLGSGLLDDRLPWLADASGRVPAMEWLAGEPGARQTLEAGADLVVFSGDKLLGGPQAGIILGRSDLVDACARHPLARALRPGGLVLGELQRTCMAYLERRGSDIPFWRMAALPVAVLMRRAQAVAAAVGDARVTVAPTRSVPGGGTLPEVTIPSAGLSVRAQIISTLRDGAPPVIARAEDGVTMLDLRTVSPADDEVIVQALRRALG